MALKTPNIYHLALYGKGLSTPGFDYSVNPELWGKKRGVPAQEKACARHREERSACGHPRISDAKALGDQAPAFLTHHILHLLFIPHQAPPLWPSLHSSNITPCSCLRVLALALPSPWNTLSSDIHTRGTFLSLRALFKRFHPKEASPKAGPILRPPSQLQLPKCFCLFICYFCPPLADQKFSSCKSLRLSLYLYSLFLSE